MTSNSDYLLGNIVLNYTLDISILFLPQPYVVTITVILKWAFFLQIALKKKPKQTSFIILIYYPILGAPDYVKLNFTFLEVCVRMCVHTLEVEREEGGS